MRNLIWPKRLLVPALLLLTCGAASADECGKQCKAKARRVCSGSARCAKDLERDCKAAHCGRPEK